jgi:hypothetical protein
MPHLLPAPTPPKDPWLVAEGALLSQLDRLHDQPSPHNDPATMPFYSSLMQLLQHMSHLEASGVAPRNASSIAKSLLPEYSRALQLATRVVSASQTSPMPMADLDLLADWFPALFAASTHPSVIQIHPLVADFTLSSTHAVFTCSGPCGATTVFGKSVAQPSRRAAELRWISELAPACSSLVQPAPSWCCAALAPHVSSPDLMLMFSPLGDLATYLEAFARNSPIVTAEMHQQHITWLHCLLDALVFLHDRGCIHRRIWPSHLLIDSPSRAVLSALADAVSVEDLSGSQSSISMIPTPTIPWDALCFNHEEANAFESLYMSRFAVDMGSLAHLVSQLPEPTASLLKALDPFRTASSVPALRPSASELLASLTASASSVLSADLFSSLNRGSASKANQMTPTGEHESEFVSVDAAISTQHEDPASASPSTPLPLESRAGTSSVTASLSSAQAHTDREPVVGDVNDRFNTASRIDAVLAVLYAERRACGQTAIAIHVRRDRADPSMWLQALLCAIRETVQVWDSLAPWVIFSDGAAPTSLPHALGGMAAAMIRTDTSTSPVLQPSSVFPSAWTLHPRTDSVTCQCFGRILLQCAMEQSPFPLRICPATLHVIFHGPVGSIKQLGTSLGPWLTFLSTEGLSADAVALQTAVANASHQGLPSNQMAPHSVAALAWQRANAPDRTDSRIAISAPGLASTLTDMALAIGGDGAVRLEAAHRGTIIRPHVSALLPMLEATELQGLVSDGRTVCPDKLVRAFILGTNRATNST